MDWTPDRPDQLDALRYALGHRPFGSLPPRQQARLDAFRDQHPEVDGPLCVEGVWRATIPLDDDATYDERTVAGPHLDELLDKLESLDDRGPPWRPGSWPAVSAAPSRPSSSRHPVVGGVHALLRA